ncbi:MAG: GNAT family N-acetyltransferase [Terriglobia bacterium]
MSGAAVEIRPCTRLEDFQRCVELQKIIWGFEDIDLVPLRMFVVADKIGGQVFGAYDGATMIGFVLALPGYRHGRPYFHSHMAAVLPDYQRQGLGRRLKLRQREGALARGVELVEWTFDPLELGNAYFNLERLGVIVRRYVRNQYGVTSSPVHGGLPTDRLVAEWWVATPRVRAVVAGERVQHNPQAERIAVPAAIARLKQSDRTAAEKVQTTVRAGFEKWLGQGYAVTGYLLEESGGTFLLEPDEEPK